MDRGSRASERVLDRGVVVGNQIEQVGRNRTATESVPSIDRLADVPDFEAAVERDAPTRRLEALATAIRSDAASAPVSYLLRSDTGHDGE